MRIARLPQTETARLHALRSYGVLESPPDARFEAIAGLAARTAGCPIALIGLLDADRQWFKAHHGIPGEDLPARIALCATAIGQPDRPLLVPDAAADARFAATPLVATPPGIRFYAGFPLVNPEGHALGTLCVMDPSPRPPGPQQQMLDGLKVLAHSAMMLLEMHRHGGARRPAGEADTLTGVATQSALHDHVEDAIRQLQAMGPDGGFTLLLIELQGLSAPGPCPGWGDQALREAAEVLGRSVRTQRGDVVGRMGESGFGVLLAGGDGREIPVATRRVAQGLARRFRQRGWPIAIEARHLRFDQSPGTAPDAFATLGKMPREDGMAGPGSADG